MSPHFCDINLLDSIEDLEIQKKGGLRAMRQARILRLASEAYEQGALLTQEDLSRLLSSSLNTIKRDLAALRKDFWSGTHTWKY